MTRCALVSVLLLAACRDPASTGTTDAAPTVSAAPSASAAPASGFPYAPALTVQVQKSLPIEMIGRGSWTAFSPKGERVLVGSPARVAMFPGDKPIPGHEASTAAFTNDGKRFYLLRLGVNVITNEVSVHATDDLHAITKVQNALNPQWRGDDLVFDRDGQVFALKPSGETKLLGPPKSAFKDPAKALAVAPGLDAMIVVDQEAHRPTGIRRVALTEAAHDALLIGTDVISKFSKAMEPLAIASPDAQRACIVGRIRSETTVWCAGPDEAPALVGSFVDSARSFAAGFLGPTKLWYRATVGAVVIVDLTAHTIAPLPIPGSNTAVDLVPLPGGKLVIARDFYRVGILDLDARKFTPLGDQKAEARAIAGLGTDDTVFGVQGSSLADGPGVLRVKVQ